jgi:hypothetical protein
MRAARAHPLRPRVASGAGTDHVPLHPSAERGRDPRGLRDADGRDRGRGEPGDPDGHPRAARDGGGRGALPTPLRPPPGPGARAGDPPLAGRDVRSGPRRLLGHGRRGRGDRDGAGHHPRQRGPRGRHQDQPAGRGAGGGLPRAPARGGAALHRGRLQLRPPDRRGRAAPLPRAARHLRGHRARRVPGARGAGGGGPGDLRRAARAHGAAEPRDLPDAHAVLQGGDRVPRLAQRVAGALRDARRPPVLARRHALRGGVPPRRPGAAAARPGPRGGADATLLALHGIG